PAPPIARLPEADIRRQYPRYRWQIMEATFLGYAAFYLVRNNLSVVAKDIEGALHYEHSDIGSLLAATAISYGLGKFVMGALSDRSNPRVFMAFGLLATAILNFSIVAASSFSVHFSLWAVKGIVHGKVWPPCGLSMGHWFSERERGLTFSIWNTAHNVGGGVAGYLAAWSANYWGGWQYAFYVPGVLASIGALYLLFRLRDTPQSVGLPPIEEYKNDYPENHDPSQAERELSMRELLVDHVLTNKNIWLLAFANFFAYITRYSMLDWGPMYLREVKNATLTGGGLAVMAIEFGGIPSTILFGWLSDKIGGRRGMVAVLCLVPILAAFTTILFIPAGYLWLDMTMLALIGLFIYPVINFIVIMALDLTGKKAIGAAAGFIGLFGYLGRTAQAKGFGWMLDYFSVAWGKEAAWSLVIGAILACTLAAILLLAFTWRMKPRA
ncbi:MAG: transporter, family, glycerol-3-phosphate transporter, partial [Candidatus Hydrogenedentes bacterium]|nr:transporter, family, glycerol-3-phosphate transporter [Candidatus Hydrogenedentota bacterium]